ncbi:MULTISPECIES: hypothetical protein [Rhizobium/Agrobacterium group]|uniref:hypothetical protein n=1 Tax=Rhizobium/Agrobacterium group TaxID=227290 RepID=UPI001ADB9A77|nr:MULTISPECIES: hypothetical protein [Rhizobium/Agrobacterium group]MBO9112461.1 hypothetical protein [Agrobacterium sp. S2/73]QXZ75971.1 hypothetical protein J5276_28165 [Agrobacterium sp. S7/73]QYA17018.1 hypothetical protein J5284_33340 [Rhizobium sp. AB2/73]UEQ85409.1 hypothetical protein I8E17_33595 [Rhizobium sp. AB2/73]
MLSACEVNSRKISNAPRVTLGVSEFAMMEESLIAKATSMPLAYKKAGSFSVGLRLRVDADGTDTSGSDAFCASLACGGSDQRAIKIFGESGKADASFLNR